MGGRTICAANEYAVFNLPTGRQLAYRQISSPCLPIRDPSPLTTCPSPSSSPLPACSTAPGSVISSTRDMSEVLITSIVLKANVTLVDIISTRMMGQYGFLATVFDAFKRHRISVDVVATSEVQ